MHVNSAIVQDLLAGGLVAWSALWLLRAAWRTVHPAGDAARGCGAGCGACGRSPRPNEPTAEHPPLIAVESLLIPSSHRREQGDR